jgi:hypothetical protein
VRRFGVPEKRVGPLLILRQWPGVLARDRTILWIDELGVTVLDRGF